MRLLSVLSLVLSVWSTSSVGMTRLLAVIDRGAVNGAGVGCEIAWGSLKTYLLETTERHRDAFQIFEWPDGRVPAPAEVIEHYRTFRFAAEDVLWFYYCGHGGTDAVEGPYFDTSQGKLSRKELRAMMESRGTQGVVLTTDNCNTPGKFEKEGPVGQGAPPLKFDHWAVLESLLRNTKGTIDFTAASGTSRAFLDPELGSNFGRALRDTLSGSFEKLDTNSDGVIAWSEVFYDTRVGTQLNFEAMKHKVSLSAKEIYLTDDDKEQTPYAYSLGAGPDWATIPSGVDVGFIHQRPFFEIKNKSGGTERGILVSFQTQFADSFEGRTVQYQLTVWDEANRQIFSGAPSGFNHHHTMTLTKENLASNANRPWQFLLADQTIPIADAADGSEAPFYLVLTIWDSPPGGTPTKIYQNKNRIRLAERRPTGLDPRP